MDLKIEDKVFLVTGASAGIGAAVMRVLAEEGAFVVGVARRAEDVIDAGPRTSGIGADLVQPEAAERIVAEVLARHGRLHGLVNNAGGLESHDGFLDISDKHWQAAFDLNFHAAVRLTRAALPPLLEQGEGSLVHITSEAARYPDASIVDYAAAKTALITVSKALAVEFGSRGVRSNIVSPGPTRTRLWDAPGGFAGQLAERFGLPVEAAVEHFVKEVRRLPSGRLGTADEVARVVAYLLSPLAEQVTGADWAIDGGALRQI